MKRVTLLHNFDFITRSGLNVKGTLMKKYLMLFALFAAAGAQAKEFFRVTDLPDGWQAHISVEGCKDNHCGGKGRGVLYHQEGNHKCFKSDDLIFRTRRRQQNLCGKKPFDYERLYL